MSTKSEVPQEPVDGQFYTENVYIPDDSDDDYQYEEVTIDNDGSVEEGEEDLEAAMKAICDSADEAQVVDQSVFKSSQPFSHIPEMVDDFLRNFLVRMGMHKTFDCFQIEWYEMLQAGKLNTELVGSVPDAYAHNQLLDNQLKNMQRERDDYRKASFKAAETLVRVKKERDFHRMHHKRVVQEKNRLIEDIRRLKKHYASYEPALKLLNDKYQTALRQKTVTSLERDRALGQLHGMEATLNSRNVSRSQAQSAGLRSTSGAPQSQMKHKRDSKGEGRQLDSVAASIQESPKAYIGGHPKDSEFPVDTRVNPFLSQARVLSAYTPKASGFRLSDTLHTHELPISCLALHPRKLVVATASDDRHWKLLGVPDGELIMTKEAHSDWLSSCCFHPDGNSLSTGSGDTTVKVWDISLGRCVLTFQGHTGAVWGCSFHTCGLFLASCSQDATAKVWDLQSERCRWTLRGHTDSVNSVSFLPFSNTVLTSSADGTLSLWDARMGLCAHTFYGHRHSCNHATFNIAGNTVASCDSRGVVRLWDVRRVATIEAVDLGPSPGNQVAFSPSGRILAVASGDSTVKLVELSTSQVTCLKGHEEAVQCVIFDHKGEYVLSGGSDGKVQIWL